MKFRDGWRERDGLTNQIHGNGTAAHLMRDDSKQMQHIGVARLQCQNLPVDLLRRRQSPRLMVLDRKFKCLLDGHGLNLPPDVMQITALRNASCSRLLERAAPSRKRWSSIAARGLKLEKGNPMLAK